MKKVFFAVLVFLLIWTISSAQQVKMSLSEGAYPVNRIDSIVWIDVSLSNSEILKEMIFDVNLEFVDGASAIAHAIPAFMLMADGTTKDITKWSQVIGSQFKYWMDPNQPSHFLGKSASARKIMQFYVKFDSEIPNYGAMIIRFTNFRILGIAGDNTINLTGPSEVSIRIEFGQRPPDERPDSVKLNLYSTMDRPRGELKLTLAYLSKYSVGQATLNLSVPTDFLSPRLLLPPADGRNGQLQKISSANGRDNYSLVINSTANPYPISPINYADLAEILFVLPQTAYGVRQVVVSGLELKDGVGFGLKTEKDLYLTINLGQPPPPVIDTTYFRAEYLVDRPKHEVRLNLSYQGKGWDKIILDLNLPQGLYLKKVEVGLLSMSYRLDGSHMEIASQYLLPDAREWYHIGTIVLGYYDPNISGWKRLMLENIFLSRHDSTIVVGNQPIIIDIDFTFTGVEDKLPAGPTDTAYVCGDYLYYRINSSWELSIYDYLGRPLKAENGQPGEGSVNLENLKYGLYFYSLRIGNKIITNKFLIY